MHESKLTTDRAQDSGHHEVARGVTRGLVAVTLIAVPAIVWAAGGGGGGESSAPSYWASWVVQMINFGIFAGIVVYFIKGPGARYFSDRREEMLADLKEARRMREEAEAKLEEYNAKLDAFEGEKQDLLDQYHEQGEREKERIIEEAKQQVEKMREDAERTIEQETRKAVADLERRAVDLAVDMAEDVLADRLDDDQQDALLDRYVGELSEVGSPGGPAMIEESNDDASADADASRVAG